MPIWGFEELQCTTYLISQCLLHSSQPRPTSNSNYIRPYSALPCADTTVSYLYSTTVRTDQTFIWSQVISDIRYQGTP
jgi:hypothetical protein